MNGPVDAVMFQHVTDCQCKWPIGNDRPGPAMLVCGKPIPEGRRFKFCDKHLDAARYKGEPQWK